MSNLPLKLISPEGIVYGGYDESNHGRYPEYFSLVLSKYKGDVVESEYGIGKAKTHTQYTRIFQKVLKRDYTFLKLSKTETKNNSASKLVGEVIASLTSNFLPSSLDFFHLYIDGKLNSTTKIQIKELLCEANGFSKNQIKLFAKGGYDKKITLVNLADGLARYYFHKNFSNEQLSQNTHKRNLQFY